ncbi:MAG: paraquat-inducible protein A [Gemmobacter sp.]
MPPARLRLFLLFASGALMVLFPVAWFAPLMTVRVTLRFWAEGSDLSVISTLQSVWAQDAVLALVLTFLAIVAPTIKVLGLALILLRLMSPRLHGVLYLIGRLAMADVFLIAVYIALFQGIQGGTITLGWGLYLFTGCVLASVALSLAAARLRVRRG